MKWPDAETVRSAAAEWARHVASAGMDVCAVGFFGSYARGDWGVGSDLDVVVVVDDGGPSSEQRALAFDVSHLPVPVDVLVYTESEWDRLKVRGMKRPAEEMTWLFQRDRI